TAEQLVGSGQQPLQRADMTQDQMGGGGIARQELPGRLDGSVRRLDGDLRRRQIAANPEIQVGNLREPVAHGVILLLQHYAFPPLYGQHPVIFSSSWGSTPGTRAGPRRGRRAVRAPKSAPPSTAP